MKSRSRTTSQPAARARRKKKTLVPTLARPPLRPAVRETPSGIPLPDLFDEIGAPPPPGPPGEFPFTRGVHPTMHRSRLWTMRQYAGFGSAAESNRRYKFLLASGQTGLSVAFDLPTQMGRDADAPQAKGEVGRTGVAICTVDDMGALLDGLPLDKISTSMTINATAATLLALYVAVADERGISRRELSGTVQNDILKEYIARGTYIYPPAPSMRLCADVFAFCRDELPRWNSISISGYHIREAGSDAAQEIAFTLADGIAYVEQAVRAGLHVDAFAPRLSFFFNAHAHFFEEIAKFRAARRMWAHIMRDRFGARDPRSMMLRFHAQTAGSTLVAAQPLNNVVRTAVEAMAAILGGCQSLHTNAYDEALALPTLASAKLALRTQQILAHESGAGDIVDPFGGSYAIEKLTANLETAAKKIIADIDAQGGMVAAIERGLPQKQIEQRALQHQRSLERQERLVVGLNTGMDGDGGDAEAPLSLHKLDPRIEQKQIARLARFRKARDNPSARAALQALTATAQGKGNLVAPILAAVKARATLGEIADALRGVFGEHGEHREHREHGEHREHREHAA